MSTYMQVLEDLGDRIIYDAKKSLKQKGKYNTGALYNSLKFTLNDGVLDFEMSKHGQWVDEGRNAGSWVPVKALNKWLTQKGIDLKYSYVINKSIKENGIKPTWFWSDAYDNNMDDFDHVLDMFVDKLFDEELVIEI